MHPKSHGNHPAKEAAESWWQALLTVICLGVPGKQGPSRAPTKPRGCRAYSSRQPLCATASGAGSRHSSRKRCSLSVRPSVRPSEAQLAENWVTKQSGPLSAAEEEEEDGDRKANSLGEELCFRKGGPQLILEGQHANQCSLEKGGSWPGLSWLERHHIPGLGTDLGNLSPYVCISLSKGSVVL